MAKVLKLQELEVETAHGPVEALSVTSCESQSCN
ncbi:hypothetical protein EV385_1666 [Krasilnikovia cinnamomea]|uniref:Uncharacterized protein n=1 Tax=Krasilnikovia cinnamomea TaxID=349313 RepID=A0A4Q7ZIH2_9ACTN|nr:class III lanthipeptide [Krasilnikovia cinnamomea]RZU49909.1 hypothetical protein EV385_1666 [Krasilnikovia cinnamomea]